MIRTIINIDEDLCFGCGLCADACHEGAIGMRNGKAVLLREDYCDGLGDCLPACPAHAITFVEKEAAAYDEAAVIEHKLRALKKFDIMEPHSGCPGQEAKVLNKGKETVGETPLKLTSHLNQWPCQIKLVPINAPYFEDANLLIAADCTAFAYANVHQEFMNGKITLIGCPKLDDVNYAEKLTAIIRDNSIKSVTVLRMQVPCCGGIQFATEKAIADSGKNLSLEIFTISTDGHLV